MNESVLLTWLYAITTPETLPMLVVYAVGFPIAVRRLLDGGEA